MTKAARVLDDQQRRELSARIDEDYPTIIALAWRAFRFTRSDDTLRRPLVLVSTVLPTVLRYLSLLALSEYCASGDHDDELNRAVPKLQKPALGNWVEFLRHAQRHFSRTPPSFCRHLPLVFRARKHQRLNVQFVIDRLVLLRNSEVGHGASPAQTEAAAPEIEALALQFELWLDEMSWLIEYPLHVRNVEGSLLKLAGVQPRNAEGCCGAQAHDLFFTHGAMTLPAFPFFFFLEHDVPTPPPGLYLFEGNTDRAVFYLSHMTRHKETSPVVLELLRGRLDRKAVTMPGVTGVLDVGELRHAAARKTASTLEQAGRENRYESRLYVGRPEVEATLNHWLEGDVPAIIISGEAGSGKTVSMYALADRLLTREDPLLLFTARTFERCDLDYVTASIVRALDRYESIESITGALSQHSRRLLVVVDALEESPDPELLFNSLMQVLSSVQRAALRLVLSIRDIALEKTISRSVAVHAAKLFHVDCSSSSGKRSRPYLQLKRLTNQEFEAFFQKYRAAYGIPTTLSELNPNASHVLRNPLVLKLACECYRGKPLPAHVSPHRVFKAYLEIRVRDQATGRVDVRVMHFLDTFVREAFARRLTQLDINDLYEHQTLAQDMFNDSLRSPYFKLLHEGIIVEIADAEDLLFQPTWVRFNFDRMFEVLMVRLLRDRSVPDVARLLVEKPVWAPLPGTLEARLLLSAEQMIAQDFEDLTPLLDDSDIARAALRALENVSYTDFPFVERVSSAWVASGRESAQQCTVALLEYLSISGRWSLAEVVYADIIASMPSSRPDLGALRTRADLIHANTARKMGNHAEALRVLEPCLEHPDPSVRVEAITGLVLLHDGTEDLEAMREYTLRCERLAKETGDDDLLVFARWSMGGYHEYCGRIPEAVLAYESIFEMENKALAEGRKLGIRGYSNDLAAIYRWYARALYRIPERILDAEGYYLRALELDHESLSLYGLSVDWNNLSDYYREVGRIDEALAYSDKEFSQSFLYPNDPEWAWSHFNRGSICFMLGHVGDAQREAEESLRISRSPGGVRSYVPHALLLLLWVALGQGQPDRAKALAAEIAQESSSGADPSAHDLHVQQAAIAVALHAGTCEPDALQSLLDGYRQVTKLPEGCTSLGMALLACARAGIRNGAVDGALRLLKRTAQELGNRHWTAFVSECSDAVDPE